MTSWVSIDQDKCDGCGICALRCQLCFRKQGDEMTVQADESCCNLCGHCVALCPTDAIVCHKLDMDNFIAIKGGPAYDTDEFISFLRQRRSHRLFKKKPIPKKDLEKLVDVCRYAPTGSNVQNVHILMVQGTDKRQRLSDLTVDFFDEIGGKAQKRIERLKAEGKPLTEELDNLQSTLQYRDKLVLAKKVGFDPIFYQAPAVIVFHSPAQTSAPKDNCVIASTTLGLVARTMGLETTYIGLFNAAAAGYEPLKKELNLPLGHQVFSTLIAGYPKLKFLKTVDRKPIMTRWE